ncbi:MAG TPA: vgr related protein [Sphingomicrobium sp.]|jgi:hypothetical protein|nr:vgr related protein [Sphingomicrobium sp.]
MRHSRTLTEGEIALARPIFCDAINYERVRIVRGKWWPFQPRGIVMAPTGAIHFHPGDPRWSEDFSKAPLELQGLLVHELTHVWQAQTRGRFYLPLMRHPFCRYAYDLVPGRAFDWYGLEQQAEIVRHAFLARHGVSLSAVPDSTLLPFA